MIRTLLLLALTGTTMALTASDASAQWRYRRAWRLGYGASPYYASDSYGYGYSTPYYSTSGYTQGYFNPAPTYASPQTYNSTSGYTPIQPTLPQPMQNNNGIAQAGHATTNGQSSAFLTVWVPSADAELWLGSSTTTSKGIQRQFQSPALEPGQDYVYSVKAKWMENGKPVEQTREVKVRAGQQSTVNFHEIQRENIPTPEKNK
jgi:uncharacterized protein (TIGR03000 family)